MVGAESRALVTFTFSVCAGISLPSFGQPKSGWSGPTRLYKERKGELALEFILDTCETTLLVEQHVLETSSYQNVSRIVVATYCRHRRICRKLRDAVEEQTTASFRATSSFHSASSFAGRSSPIPPNGLKCPLENWFRTRKT